jgi:hypothetical protein
MKILWLSSPTFSTHLCESIRLKVTIDIVKFTVDKVVGSRLLGLIKSGMKVFWQFSSFHKNLRLFSPTMSSVCV